MLFFMTPCKTQVTYFNNHMLALLQIAFIRVYILTVIMALVLVVVEKSTAEGDHRRLDLWGNCLTAVNKKVV